MLILLDTVMLAGGLALLLAGGDRTVRGASVLATNLGVPPIAVGLTIVAFGTSAPELVVNLLAAARGSSAIAFGNVVGSNIANIGLILSLAALLRPLAVGASVIAREIPMMILASLAVVALGNDSILSGSRSILDRPDGIVLLLLFGVFMYYTVTGVLRQRHHDPFVAAVAVVPARRGAASTVRNAAWLVLGLGGLALGGHLTVEGAVGLAREFGAPEALIGVTLVAVGTSLPELVTTLIAARRGQYDLAVGNVVGSNIFNLLFILGLGSTLAPIEVPPGGVGDMLALLIFAVALLPMAITGKHTVSRTEGALLLTADFGYILWRVSTSAAGG